ncbi:MAG: hypothetical protein WDN45_13725 [Caulobacteraceae bacterium]
MFRLDDAWASVTALDGSSCPAQGATGPLPGGGPWCCGGRPTGWRGGSSAGRPASRPWSKPIRPAADELRAQGLDLLSPLERQTTQARVRGFIDLGAPQDLAERIGTLRPLTSTSDVADLALSAGWSFLAAGAHLPCGGRVFGFDRLRAAAGGLKAEDAYERQAVRQLIVDFLAEQTAIHPQRHGPGPTRQPARAARTTRGGPSRPGFRRVRPWSTRRRPWVADIEGLGEGWSFAKLTIAGGAMRQLAATAQAIV